MPDYFDTGFTVRQPAWHGQGLVLDEHPTDWADARVSAGLTWEPEAAPSWVRKPTGDLKCMGCAAPYVIGGSAIGGVPHTPNCTADTTSDYVKVADCVPDTVKSYVTSGKTWAFIEDPEHKQILRSDTGAVLGSGLGKGYQPIYHGADAAGETGASMEQVIDAFFQDQALKFETGGASRGGKDVWALMLLDEPFQVPGDESETIPYIALLNNHDGSGALTVVRTMVRVVCWNTYQMALEDARRSGLTYSFRHSGDPRARIEEARSALAGLRDEAARYREMAIELSTLRVDERIIDEFLVDFLPSPEERGEVISDRVRTNIATARATFKSNYNDSVTLDGIRGTGYGLFQASTEYLDHLRAYRTQDSYLGRSILSGDKAKAHALTLVREYAGV